MSPTEYGLNKVSTSAAIPSEFIESERLNISVAQQVTITITPDLITDGVKPVIAIKNITIAETTAL